MKTYLLFLLLLIPILMSCSNRKVIVEDEVPALIDQLYENKIISLNGKKELIRITEGKEPKLFSLWEDSYNPRMGFGILKSEESKEEEIIITVSAILHQISFIEFVHSAAKESSQGYSLMNYLDNPENLVKEAEKLMGENWKSNRPKRITYDSTEEEVSLAKNQLNWWIQTFSKVNIINERVANDAKAWLGEDEVKDQNYQSNQSLELEQFFRFLMVQVAFYENEEEYSLEQKSFLDTLLNHNLISHENYKTLLESYQPNEVKSQMEILSSMPNSFIFDLKKVNTSYYKYKEKYSAFLDTLKSHLIPELRIDSIRVFSKEFVDMEYGGTYENDILSVKLNGIEYWQRAGDIFPYYDVNASVTMGTLREHDVFFIQQFLCDTSSPYRLYMIEDKDRLRNRRGSKMGVVLLDSNQFNVLKELPWTFLEFHSFNNYQQIQSFDTIYSTIKDLQTIGIASQLDDKAINQLIPEIRLSSTGDIDDILPHLPNTVADLELIIDDEFNKPTYTFPKLINRLVKVSNGTFIPKNIRKGWKEYSEEKVFPSEVGFTFNDIEYYYTIKDEGEAYEFLKTKNLIKLVNMALFKDRIHGQFYCINSSLYSCYNYIYLTETQYDFMSKRFPDNFHSQD